VLSEAVRNGLARTICGQYKDDANTIHCVTLDGALEEKINAFAERTQPLPPMVGRQITESIAREINKLMTAGHAGVVLCSPQVRAFVRKLIEASLPTVAVLSYGEIVKGVSVESVGIVGAQA